MMDEFKKWQSKLLPIKQSVKSQINEYWLNELLSDGENFIKAYKVRVAMKVVNDELKSLKHISNDLFDIVQLIDSKMSLISLLIHHNVDKDDITEIGVPLKNLRMKEFALLVDQLKSHGALVVKLMEMKFIEYGHFFCELEKQIKRSENEISD